ncbi:xylulokinase [Pasteurella testudinis DSM 23072]|uniref:Xylulokinase n=1 Tax=Pasteurella testudinis DSM 23072 TaxID=1122938 RepID=A0A1W1UT65_9PAST|nr:FGGY-family carbohydrate kinase [Pasteurella testudinis]SMB84243.1 xylulokinase [Pasteurella testudinis DSM 23072]SUB50869.1 autoinducer 2 kinase lsrK [Pasteurella testudinis]
MNYLLGTDIGTSGAKTILMDCKGNLIAQDLQEYGVLTPKPLWAEQWPDVWLDATKRSIANAVKKAVQNAGIDIQQIKGIAISGLYGGSGIPLDSEMNPIRPCMIWMDRRAAQETQWVKENVDLERLQAITYNSVDPYYGFTKMLWLKNNEPDNWQKTALFLPPNNYVMYKLTGKIAIDYSSAGNIGGIFDMNTRTWSQEMSQALGIPLDKMPQNIVESTDIVGTLSREASHELGLPFDLPVIAAGIDCGAASIGLGIYQPNIYSATVGTSMCAALISEKPVKSDGLIVWPYLYNAKKLSYNFAGSNTAGAIIKWFRDTLCHWEIEQEKRGGDSVYTVLNRQAEKVPVGSGGLVVLPYFMGERSPIWDSHAKGTIVGLSLTHSKAHIFRAFMEAVAYALRQAMETTGENLGEYIIIAGGATKSKLWKQIFADVTSYPVVCPLNDTEANLGDVILAGVGTGVLTFEEVQKWQLLDEKIMPNPQAHALYSQYYQVYKSIYQHLKNDMATLSALAQQQ